MSQIFLVQNFMLAVRAIAEKSDEVVSLNSLSTQMLWSIILFRMYKSSLFMLLLLRKQMEHTVRLCLLK